MKDLIEALQIFQKYLVNPDSYDAKYCCNCSHDSLQICSEFNDISKKDIKRLEELGFDYNAEDGWYSHKYGSC